MKAETPKVAGTSYGANVTSWSGRNIVAGIVAIQWLSICGFGQQLAPGSLRVRDLEVLGNAKIAGTLQSKTVDRKSYVVGQAGWYRIVQDGSDDGLARGLHSGKLRIAGDLGNNRFTDISFYVSGSSFHPGSVNIVNNGDYNGGHISRIRTCGTPSYPWTFCVDVLLHDVEEGKTMVVEVQDADGGLALLSDLVYEPNTTTATNPLEFPADVVGGGSGCRNFVAGLNGQKVGIGTGTPVERLHVVGNLRVDGSVVTSGAQTNTDRVAWLRTADGLTGFTYDPSGYGSFQVWSGNLYFWTDVRLANSCGFGPIGAGDRYFFKTMDPSYTWHNVMMVTNRGVTVCSDEKTDGYEFDVNGHALIRSNLTVSGTLVANGGNLTGITAAQVGAVSSADATKFLRNDVDGTMNGKGISNLKDPAQPQDAATKQYVDSQKSAAGSAASAYLSTSQSIPANTVTTIRLNTEEFDLGNALDTTTFTYTVPASGTYLLTGSAQILSLANGKQCSLYVYRNNASIIMDGVHKAYSSGSAANYFLKVNKIVSLAAGDQITLRISHNDSVARTVEAGSDKSFLSITRIQ